jgi:glutathione S-transferase
MQWEDDNSTERGEDTRREGQLVPYPTPAKMPTVLARSTSGVGHEVYVGGPKPPKPVVPEQVTAMNPTDPTVVPGEMPGSATGTRPGSGAGTGTGTGTGTPNSAAVTAPAGETQEATSVPPQIAPGTMPPTTAEAPALGATEAIPSPKTPLVLAAPAVVDAVLEEKKWTTGTFYLGMSDPSCVGVASYISFLGLDKPAASGSHPEITFVNITAADLTQPWYQTLSAGTGQMPLLVCNGVVYGGSCQIVKMLFLKYAAANAAKEDVPVFTNVVNAAAKITDYATYLFKYFATCHQHGGQEYVTRPEGEVQEVVNVVINFLADLESNFSKEVSEDATTRSSLYIAGNRFSPLDCCIMPIPYALYHLCCLPIPQWYPNVWKWFVLCMEQPGLTPSAGHPDAGLSFWKDAPKMGMMTSVSWFISRNFGDRHLGNSNLRWFAKCNPKPVASSMAVKPDGAFARAC